MDSKPFIGLIVAYLLLVSPIAATVISPSNIKPTVYPQEGQQQEGVRENETKESGDEYDRKEYPDDSTIQPIKTEPSIGGEPVEEENETEEEIEPRIIIQPEIRKVIDQAKEQLESTDPIQQEQVKEEIKEAVEQVVQETKLRIAVEIDSTCPNWRVSTSSVIKRIETDGHLFFLLEIGSDELPNFIQDPCVLRMADEQGLTLFLRQVKQDLEREAQEKAEELDLKEKRGVTLTPEQLKQKIEQEVEEEELPPIEQEYETTSNERIAYQAFVTPDSPQVQSAKKSSSQSAYQEAVSWVWISDSDFHGENEHWMKPEEFLQSASNSKNPTQRIASDCSEQANTLVSILRAQKVSAYDVKVVLGKVDFQGSIGGHAWVEIKQSDGSWMPLEATSGPIYDDGKVKESNGIPFDYWSSHEYPVIERWVEYNDIYFVDYKTGKTNAPSSWPTKKLSGPDSTLSFGETPQVAELEEKFTTSLFCEYQGHLVYAQQTRLSMEAVISHLDSVDVNTASLLRIKNNFVSQINSLASVAESNNQSQYNHALEQAKQSAEQFKQELSSIISSNGLNSATVRASVQAQVLAQQDTINTLQANRLRYCKRISVEKFQDYLSNLKTDARKFKQLGCSVSNLDEVVQRVSTYEAYLEDYMNGGYVKGVDEIESQIFELQAQLENVAQICYRNKLAENYNTLWEVVNDLSAEGVSLGSIPDDLNQVAIYINTGDVEQAQSELASIRSRVSSRIEEAES